MGTGMTVPPITEANEHATSVAVFLEARLHEYNVEATGYADGADLCFTITDDDGTIVAGVAGDTWGGCCVIKQLWVGERYRGRGYGRALVSIAEDEARRRRCRRLVVSTHTFQAPGFYERLGYHRIARVEGHPEGHATVVFAKSLADNG